MWEKVEEALDRLVAEGTLEPVDYSNWVAPIIAVIRSDHKSMCICGDFQTTINPESKLNHYLIPKIEDLFFMLRRGKFFTKLDLSQAYQLLNLEELSRKYVVISIHKAYTHICCTVYTSFVPGMFQKAMEQRINFCMVPCILMIFWSEFEHLHILEEILWRLAKALVRNYHYGDKWLPGIIVLVLFPKEWNLQH